MRTLCFLEPGHFHAALTLREPSARVRDAIVVYATEGPELTRFLALVEAFNTRAERPTRWRPDVRRGPDPLARLVAERGGGAAGDAVVLAGRTDVKIGWIRRLHDAGFAILADKPWLAGPTGLDDMRHALGGAPLAMEMMTGAHEITTRLEHKLVATPDVLGDVLAGDEPGLVLESVHHLDKQVNGAPLRRPAWFFDVRVQGDGLSDIPTHQVAHAQRVLPGPGLTLVGAQRSATRVPRAVFTRITGEAAFPPELGALVAGDELAYLGNAELAFRRGRVLVRVATRWDLTEPAGGGDAHRAIVRGTRAAVRIEQSAATGWRRRVLVEPRADAAAVEATLRRAVATWQDELPGLAVAPHEGALEVVVPPALRGGHESHFPLVLDEFLRHLDAGAFPAALAAETRAKYELLAEAGAACRAAEAAPSAR
jgi:hypothetical protein